jgi:hypothetical protein
MKRIIALSLAWLMMASKPSLAAFTFTHVNQGSSNASHTTVRSAVTIASGHLVLVGMEMRPAANGDNFGVTDSAGDTFTIHTCNNGTAAWAVGIAWAITSGLSAGTVTVADGASGTATTIGSSVNDVTGFNSSSPEDAATYACNLNTTGTSSTPTVTSGSPSQSGDQFYSNIIYANGPTFTEDASWAAVSSMGNTSAQSRDAQLLNAGSGTETRAPSFGGTNAIWGLVVLGLNPAGAVAPHASKMSLIGVQN